MVGRYILYQSMSWSKIVWKSMLVDSWTTKVLVGPTRTRSNWGMTWWKDSHRLNFWASFVMGIYIGYQSMTGSKFFVGAVVGKHVD